MIKVLAFSGSTRKGSFNQHLVDLMTTEMEMLDIKVNQINLRDYPLPIYQADDEQENGLPDNAKKIRQLLQEHQGLMIGSPEYNGFMTPLLLNTIDWASRSEDGQGDLSGFKDKFVTIASTSPGAIAGLRAANHLRTMLLGLGSIVLPNMWNLAQSMQAFNESGELKNDLQKNRCNEVCQKMASIMKKQLS